MLLLKDNKSLLLLLLFQDEDLVCFVPGECDLSSSIVLKFTDTADAEACLLECQGGSREKIDI